MNQCCCKVIKYSGETNQKVELGQGVDEGMGEGIMARTGIIEKIRFK